MSFALLHKLVTYLISGLGLYALSLGGELGAGPSALFAVAWAVSFFVEGERLGDRLWIQGWNVAVVAFFVLEVARGVLGEPFLALGLEYAGFLQISRLFNRRAARDHQQIAVLSFLHLIAATVLSTDLAYGFVFVGFVITTPWMLVLTQLRQEIEGNYETKGERKGPDVRRVLASRRIVGPGFLVGTAALTLPIFLVTVALFLMFPRVGLGFLSFGARGGQRTAGFGQNVELGDFGVIRDNPEVVMRLKLPLPEGAPKPAELPIRMRGTSFDRYDGRRWTRSDSMPIRVRSNEDTFLIQRQPRLEDARMEVILDRLDEPVIFLPPDAVALEIPPRIEGAENRPRRVQVSQGFDYRYIDDDGLGLRYTVFVSTDPRERFGEALEPEARQRYLELPDGVDRVATFARALTRETATDRERADAIQAHLRDSGTYAYSLEMPDVGDRDPLEVFLFEARYGHCEYYSTAMAVMLRAIGIPSRNVTGFAGAHYNPYGDYYAVRHGDAHSWVEAHVDGRWVTYDPTPAARGDLGIDDGLFADVRAIMDALRTRWNRDVVAYDLRSQVQGLRRFFRWSWRVRNQLAALTGGGADAPDAEAPSGASSTDRFAPLVGGALALVVVFVLAWLLVRRRRRGDRGGPTATPSAQAAVRLYRELERALSRRGHARPRERTPREHAEELVTEGHDFADVALEVTKRYEAGRWGGDALPEEELSRLRRKIATIMRPPAA